MKMILPASLLKCCQQRGFRLMMLTVLLLLGGMGAHAQQGTVISLGNIQYKAGSGTDSTTPVLTTYAKFNHPAGIALDPSGNNLFLADDNNNAIRWVSQIGNKVSSYTYDAFVSTNGISSPIAVAIDVNTNIYVLNYGNGKNGSVLKFNGYYYLTYNNKQLLATNAANLTNATSLALDGAANLYVTVKSNTVIRIAAGTGTITTVGIITNKYTSLRGVAVMTNGVLALTDAGNNGIWLMNPANTNIYANATPFTGFQGVGDVLGPPGWAAFNDPENIVLAGNGVLVVADCKNNKVKWIDASGNVNRLFGVNSTYWGGGTPGWNDGSINPNESIDPVEADLPYGLAISASGIIYDTEQGYMLLREATGTGLPAPPPPPPSAPGNLTATASLNGNAGQVVLNWSAVASATSYNIKSSSSSGSEQTIANTNSATYTDNNVIPGNTYFYVVSGLNAGGEGPDSAEVMVTIPLPPVPAPQIGYVDFPAPNYTSVFHPVSAAGATFNNYQPIVIEGADGSQTYFNYGTTIISQPPTNGIPVPTSSSASAPSGYQDGLQSLSAVLSYSIGGYPPSPVLPDMTIRAIGEQTGHSNSPIVQTRFQYVTANPVIIGNNAAQFNISDLTAGATLYYTLDGSNPATNPAAISLGSVAAPTNLWTVGFNIITNTLFQVVAVYPNFQTSSVVSAAFSPSNYVANTISFGFGSGEASSVFLATPGQTFYAPVTLTTLSATKIYSLQFNLTVTNAAAANPVAANSFGFQSMLMKPIVPIPTNYPPGYALYTPIQPLIFTNSGFVSGLFTNDNLLGVGWVERYGETNLYDSLSQTLISYSLAHDDLFPNAQQPTGVIVGAYAFQVPTNALPGDQYQIQIGRPSATSDGVGAPGSSVYIASPTNGILTGLQNVTVTNQIMYLVGSVYPFRWINAGDFGTNSLMNADVQQVFQTAVYQLNSPPENSDFFDAMDSCGNYGTNNGSGIYVQSTSYSPSSTFLTNDANVASLFGGTDTNINNIVFGDGVLDVCDVYVTFRRSLDPSLIDFERFWSNGQREAMTVPNISANVALKSAVVASVKSNVSSGSTVSPQVNFSAGIITNGSAGQVISVPINASIFGSYPLRVLMLNLTVEPLDGSPALTTAVSFNQTATVLGTPYTTASIGNGNYSAVWLNSGNAGLTGTVTLGNLLVTLPAGVTATSAYAVHFDHASASPNGIASFPKQTTTGLLTTTSRNTSSYGDGIPDWWRLLWFGTTNNLLSVSNACPSGDGISNWKKFVAGVDPNVANNFPSLHPKPVVPAGYTAAIHWPTVSGVTYVIQRASSLYGTNWTAISTNIGTGQDLEYDDTSAGQSKFYRVLISP